MTQLPERLALVFKEIPHLTVESTGARRLRVKSRPEALPALLGLLKNQAGYVHLSAISCVDWHETDEFELVYHLWSYELQMLVSAHIDIPKKPGRYITVHDIYTPAAFFERDIHEIYGVYFEGPDRVAGAPPMLKSFATEQYARETFESVDYSPEWLQEIEAQGGKFVQ
jgi:NADH-quinone oxidoreductase subunit C